VATDDLGQDVEAGAPELAPFGVDAEDRAVELRALELDAVDGPVEPELAVTGVHAEGERPVGEGPDGHARGGGFLAVVVPGVGAVAVEDAELVPDPAEGAVHRDANVVPDVAERI